jgi:hypothetical protein
MPYPLLVLVALEQQLLVHKNLQGSSQQSGCSEKIRATVNSKQRPAAGAGCMRVARIALDQPKQLTAAR